MLLSLPENMGVGILTLLVSTILCLIALLSLILKFFYRVWWNPIQIQSMLRSQGIKGPSYRFIHGNNKEVLDMKRNSMSRPMKLSHDILPRIQPHIHSWINIYGRNFVTWRGSKAQLIITEPDLIKEVLYNKHGVYTKPKFRGYIKKLLGDGLSGSEGKKWYKHRKLANRAFHAENLKGMVPAMISSVEMMLKRWREREAREIEIFEEFKVTTADIISRAAFGSSYLEGQKIFEMLNKLASIAAENAYKIRLPGIGKFSKTSDDIKAEKLEHGIRESIIEIIHRREENIMMGELDDYGCDYLGLLVKANQDGDESKRISIDDMIDECKTFYFSGHESTSTSLTWTVLLLALNTDWQEKARMEVMELFGSGNSTLDVNGIAKLKMMTMIINESLRLYPPVLNITRSTSKQVKLGELLLPQNIELIIPSLVAHNDQKIWGDDVHLFKPERFSEGVTKAAENTMAFLPFGMGPRSCVGLNFAATEVKLALSMILQHYAFTLSPSYVHSPIQHLTNRPQHGVHIILHPL